MAKGDSPVNSLAGVGMNPQFTGMDRLGGIAQRLAQSGMMGGQFGGMKPSSSENQFPNQMSYGSPEMSPNFKMSPPIQDPNQDFQISQMQNAGQIPGQIGPSAGAFQNMANGFGQMGGGMSGRMRKPNPVRPAPGMGTSSMGQTNNRMRQY